MENVDNKLFMPTGNDGIEISTGDSAVRPENFEQAEAILHHQFLGEIQQHVTNIDDDADIPGVDYVQVTAERTEDHEYIHFDYEGGTGFSLRMPRIVRNASKPTQGETFGVTESAIYYDENGM
jgi:hypothetical protein